ncbi:hypothetical protein JI752_014450 [Lysobacter sp. MMG2]|uniref:hypothetical protein n=1 Tax=Lysobacter sp. MMG2 TaxID=2801338 RepID=UPI001C22C942|nr:hypothetical protein [Lysobacter sp. MMG2]MBU8977349.1 hypothetical protein [Lysobacter sp. MMG2]
MKPMTTWMTVALLALAGAAHANADKVAMILQQQREIRAESEHSTGAYARFDAGTLDRMHQAQDRVFRLLDGKSSVDQLRPSEQVEVFNALEEVKAILADNERNKQKCWREHKLGTTMKITRCATLAELEQVRRDSEQWKADPSVCGQSSSGADCGGNMRRGLGGNP